MRRWLWIVPFMLLVASYATGQEATPAAPPTPAATMPTKVKVYTVGPGVTAPELLQPDPLAILAGKCKIKRNDWVELSVLIDAEGQARNIYYLHALGTDLDKYVLQLVAEDRFRPGSYDGKPVVVAESLQVNMHSCMEERAEEQRKESLLDKIPIAAGAEAHSRSRASGGSYPFIWRLFSNGTYWRNS